MYFENCKTEEEIRVKYKELVKQYHPDIYGEKGNEIMQEVHKELEKALKEVTNIQFVADDLHDTDEQIKLKQELAQQAMKHAFPEGFLYASYWKHKLQASNHRNPITEHNFSGWNIWSLELEMHLKGYKSAEWSTFNQYKEKNQQVQKGQKGKRITLAIITKSKEENNEKEQKERIYYKGYTVFNVEQTKESEVVAIEEVKQIEVDKFAGYEVIG